MTATDVQTRFDLAGPETAQGGAAPMNAEQLLGALRGHYLKPGEPRPGSVLLTEVAAPSPNRRNRADAIHVGLWPSRGHTVDVHEIKVSLGDFRRELEQPAKAEAWWGHSNTFWIVAPDTKVAPPDLLPPGWGLMVPGRGRRFTVVVKAAFRDLQPTTALLAALLVSMETDRDNVVRRESDRLRAQHYREIEQARRQAAAAGDPQTRRRLDHLDRLEDLIGFRLDDYEWPGGDQVTAESLGAALRSAVVEKQSAREFGRRLDGLDAQVAQLAALVAQARKNAAGVVSR